MSSIAPVQSTPIPQPQTPRATQDADGDKDGTQVAPPPPVTYQAQVSRPTATLGNHVNTVA